MAQHRRIAGKLAKAFLLATAISSVAIGNVLPQDTPSTGPAVPEMKASPSTFGSPLVSLDAKGAFKLVVDLGQGIAEVLKRRVEEQDRVRKISSGPVQSEHLVRGHITIPRKN